MDKEIEEKLEDLGETLKKCLEQKKGLEDAGLGTLPVSLVLGKKLVDDYYERAKDVMDRSNAETQGMLDKAPYMMLQAYKTEEELESHLVRVMVQSLIMTKVLKNVSDCMHLIAFMAPCLSVFKKALQIRNRIAERRGDGEKPK